MDDLKKTSKAERLLAMKAMRTCAAFQCLDVVLWSFPEPALDFFGCHFPLPCPSAPDCINQC
jgi:hypothetical protein